jgi:superfamily II DNA/RNA helicase
VCLACRAFHRACILFTAADHLRTNDTLPLNSLRFLVLDEADRMLEASFAPDLGTILAKLPSEGRQTLLFSATMTRSIQKLQELSSRPVFAFESKSDAEFELVERLEQHVRIGIHANRLEITTSSHCSLVSSILPHNSTCLFRKPSRSAT